MPIDEKFKEHVLHKVGGMSEDAPPAGKLNTVGPRVRVTVSATCVGCVHYTAEKWELEDENEYVCGYYSCCAALPGAVLPDARPPEQCPFLKDAVEKAVSKFREGTDENR